MEIRTGKYTNFALTVIALLLAALVFQTSVGLVSNVQAQRLDDIRNQEIVRNQQQAGLQAAVNTTSDPAVATGLQAIASAVGDVATALREVARSNERIAEAVGEIDLQVNVPDRP